MECVIRRDGTTFEVRVNVENLNSSSSNHYVVHEESDTFLINAVVNMKFKYTIIRPQFNRSLCEHYFYVHLSKNNNTTLIYYMSLSVPEFDIKNITYIVDDSRWRLLQGKQTEGPFLFSVIVNLQNVAQLNPFANLFDDDKLTDFEIQGEDGSVEIHKVVVAAVSAKFKSMVESLDEDERCLTVPDVKMKTIQHFKLSVYKNILPEDGGELLNLLLLAAFFNMKWLEYKCVDKILSNLTASSALQMLDFAFQHKLMTLFLGILETVQSGGVKVNDIRKHYLNE